MDNANFHKGKEMKKTLLIAGHIIQQHPAYSPGFNTIEKKWDLWINL